MLEKLRLVEERYLEMEARAAQPDLYADAKAAAKLLREQKQLEPIMQAYRAYLKTQQELDDVRSMLSGETDEELRELCQEELRQAKRRLAELEQELKVLLLPRDANDDKNVIMEIRGGVGGEESALFAHSLFRMYTYVRRRARLARGAAELQRNGARRHQGSRFYDLRRGRVVAAEIRVRRTPRAARAGDGIRRARAYVHGDGGGAAGDGAGGGRNLRPEDIEMQVYRSSGAGGQHINKTSSAVRLIHKPTGIVAACQEERSQVQNREKCMQMLASKLYELEQQRIDSTVTNERRSQVGTGMRNERIRTYNFPQGRVTDHRIGLTLYKLGSILDGDLDELIDALVTADQAEKLQKSEE